MRVSLIKSDKVRSINIPDNPSGNFWVTDYDESGKEENLISIKEEDGKWKLISNEEIYIISNNEYLKSIELQLYNFYTLIKASTNESIIIFVSTSYDEKMANYYINSVTNPIISAGSMTSNNIVFNTLNDTHIKIQFENGKYVLYAVNNSPAYVNNLRVDNKKVLEYGDTIFINGLKIIYLKYENECRLDIYYFGNNLLVNGLNSAFYEQVDDQYQESSEDIDMKWYNDDSYFHKTPRFVSEIVEKELKIDPPPAKEEEKETPVILTVGPMLTMSMSSMVSAFVSISSLKNNNGSISSAIPSIVMSIAMIASTLLWPFLLKKYEERQKAKKEKERNTKYGNYIDSKRRAINEELNNQVNILKRNYPSISECNRIIVNKDNLLWQKRIEDDDFLKVNLGYGNYPMKLKISYPEEQFTMAEDSLKSMADNLSREPKILNNVPVPYSFYDNIISSIVGRYEIRSEYLKKLIFQIITFHSYNDLKIVIFTDDDKKNNWGSVRNLPHCFDDERQVRFFASNSKEYSSICSYLEKIFNSRSENENNFSQDKKIFDKYYLIITDSFRMIRSQDFIEKLLSSKKNYGFSMLISNKNISTLPEQCKSFITLNDNEGELSRNVLSEKNQKFTYDSDYDVNYNECYKILSNIPIESNSNGQSAIPDKVGFLEMYDVGKVSQLNSLNRWKKSNPMQSLATPVGYGKNNELQYIDLHEKMHGPHGLVAGMTGSGKSEFIITYILSLAVNYNPLEVQFILIDYKGGGLAGAFENANSGKKLPHLIGTITNLDLSEIKRSLSSIESELKRRQRLFNIARDKSGESTVDIYKYQRLYREGKVDEPVSHLFIISDEFAELKTQQPEFMDQLISTARIGRSLGVHLILATQKPSGVVDPQIWSNTRFRVCLRVQDKSDSNEVIKCPDAAFLKQTGRFYFQVGYNEVFTLGQSAYAGGKYIPKEKTKKPLDTKITFINNIGQVIAQADTRKQDNKDQKNYGEELSNIVNYLADVAKEENIKCKPLWLDKIPSFIKIEDLINKYSFKVTPNILNIPIGEFDIPQEQRQSLLTVNFTNNGNSLLYGATGSGKENFLMTLIYSSMCLYSPSDVNFYIMDFGAEILKVFESSPYIGGVLNIDDDEKIEKLFKLISNFIEERKSLFSMYGGNYLSYVQKSGNKIPNIVIVLNNFEAYQDTYEKYDDLLNSLTRECIKFGIYFIITCNTPNGLRFKLKQNFSQIFCLQQNNEDDYSTILGNIGKSYPSKLFGRGIIKSNNVYEFQTASISAKDDMDNIIEQKINECSNKFSFKAKKIPTLPKVVDYNSIKDYISNNSYEVIIGYEKTNLDVIKLNLKKNLFNIVMSNDFSIQSNFINSYINQTKNINNSVVMVAEAESCELYEYTKQNIVHEQNNFNDMFSNILNYENKCYEVYEQNNFNKDVLQGQKFISFIIIGLDGFVNKLSEENKNKLGEFFTKLKDINIISFTMFDSLENFKKYEYNGWFKDSFNSTDGIWIGSGIDDQFMLKPSVRIPELKQSISDDFCFTIIKGKPNLVKYVYEFKKETDEIIGE